MISFRIGSLPVAIRPIFFVTVVLIGVIGPQPRVLASLALWVAIVLASVLLHELGHALVARRYGATAEIELFAMGGLTKWQRDPPVGPGGRVLIAAAGSAIGISIGLIVFLALGEAIRSDAFSPLLEQALVDIIFVNLGWGILNWLPIRLLDGGHILAGLMEIWFPKNHQRIANVVFLASAAALVGAALWLGQLWLAMLFAFFGFIGESQAQQTRRSGPSRRDQALQPRLAAARDAVASGDYETAAEEAASLLPRLRSAEAQTAASRILVRALLAQGRVQEALQLVESAPEGFHPGPVDVGRVLLAAERIKPAIEILSSALSGGNGDALPVLTSAYTQAGTFTEAVVFLSQMPTEVLDQEPIRALATEADRAGSPGDAAALRRLAAEIGTEFSERYPSSE